MTKKGTTFICKDPEARRRKIGTTLRKRYLNREIKKIYGREPGNKVKREIRKCICPCKKEFICKVTSKRKFYKSGCVWNVYENPGKNKTKETREKISSSKKGKTPVYSQESKDRWLKNHSEENHWNWKGGKFVYNISRKEWNVIRYKVYKRDQFTCQSCNKNKVRLDVHHIILNRASKSNDLDILISFCRKCHTKFERKMTILYRQSAGKITNNFISKILRDYTLEDSRKNRIYDIVRSACIHKDAEVRRNSNLPLEKIGSF